MNRTTVRDDGLAILAQFIILVGTLTAFVACL